MKIKFVKTEYQNYIAVGIGLLVLSAIGYGVYRYSTLVKEYEAARQFFANTIASTTTFYKGEVSKLESVLANNQAENAMLTEELQTEKGKNDYFDFQLKTITNSVGTLERLASTDRELLQKYSKVYFLSENYAPATLTDITSSEFAFNTGKPLRIHTGVWSSLDRLLQAAKSNGTPLQIISGYRSFGEQSSLKSSYRVVYGSGANKFSADQGYSEHQLGTTVDFTTPVLGETFDNFKTTAAYKWLLEHAYEYGFGLSYPEDNQYYVFEPWHWRFVGVKLATRLHDDKQFFYDLDQRVINQYLADFFN